MLYRRGLPSSRHRLFMSLLFSILVLAARASAQQDPIKNFCRRFGHQTTVVDRKLYTDGGLVNWNPISTYLANYTNTWLLFQDLDHDSPDGMPPLNASLSKNSSVPNVHGGYLWGDEVNKQFFLFGGEYYNTPPPSSFVLYSYDILNNFWVSQGSPQQTAIQPVSYGAGATVSERGEGYYYGGWLSNNSVSAWGSAPLATTGLVKYDMDSNSWTNNTGPDNVRRAEGVLLFLPASDGGLLVYFGGVTDLYGNGTVTGQPLDRIFVYDVLSSKWYVQTASGDVPGNRRRFCAGATWASDRSSYNIYMYGGAGFPPDTAGYDDLYVLTLPSFTWIKLYPTDGNATGAYPHHSLTCNIVSGAQMLIIGGTFPLSDDCDVPQQWGTHNADLTEAFGPNSNPGQVPSFWQLYAPNETAYRVPDPIVRVIGGGPDGHATKTAPAHGWDSKDLPVLMTRTATFATRTPTRDVGDGGRGSKGDDHGKPALSTGAIAGIAAGGGVLLIALAVGVILCCRRRAKVLRAERTAATTTVDASKFGLSAAPHHSSAPNVYGPYQYPPGLAAVGAGGYSDIPQGWSPSHGGGGGGGSPYSPTSPYHAPGSSGFVLAHGSPTAPVELAATHGSGYTALTPVPGGGVYSDTGTGSHSDTVKGSGTGTSGSSGVGGGGGSGRELVQSGLLKTQSEHESIHSGSGYSPPVWTAQVSEVQMPRRQRGAAGVQELSTEPERSRQQTEERRHETYYHA